MTEGIKLPAIVEKPDAHCYKLFDALADSDGYNKELIFSEAGRAIMNQEPAVQAGVLLACLDRKAANPYRASTVLAARSICAVLSTKQLTFSDFDIAYMLEFTMREGQHSIIKDDLAACSDIDTDDDIEYLLQVTHESPHSLIRYDNLVDIIEQHIQNNGLSQSVGTRLSAFADALSLSTKTSDDKKLARKVKSLSGDGSSSKVGIIPHEAWSDRAIADLTAMDSNNRQKWDQLFAHAIALTSTTPSKKWLTQAQKELDNLGDDEFRNRLISWFSLVGKRGTKNVTFHHEFDGDPNELIASSNVDILKGLAWYCSLCQQNDDIARVLGNTAEVCFKKVPNVGARCPKLANACVAVLAGMPFKEAIAQLSRLKTGAKKSSSLKQIDKGLGQAAERSGMTVIDLQEMSVPEYGFTEIGKLVKQVGEYQAEIAINGARSAELLWTDAKGKTLNSVPAAVKRDFADDLKTLKKTAADIEKILPSIRSRIESSLLQNHHWTYKAWRERYLDHLVCGAFARRLIWNFSGKAGIWSNGQIVDASGNPLEIEEFAIVELWHPIGAQAAEVQAWRQWMIDHNITQPFKQAHREIYVLTDAELRTETYSNRFAAHIIKQHQFTELAKQRGWKYNLQGQWDSANTPELILQPWDLRVEFFVEPVENETSNSGIFTNVATDQVRFTRLNTADPLPLTEILPIVFTEVMRDVDLFIGVCSVGNDPTWQDTGAHGTYGAYWNNYSFGDLTETAETRKEVLQAIIPRLKIGSRCSFKDKFLVVKGDLRTYNIHLGSGNILMEPNGQYLCIVPSSNDHKEQEDVVLPFEGDRTMSIILSKCFLLANDSKIKDSSILSQIRRK